MDLANILPDRFDRIIFVDRWRHRRTPKQIAERLGLDLERVEQSLRESTRKVLEAGGFFDKSDEQA